MSGEGRTGTARGSAARPTRASGRAVRGEVGPRGSVIGVYERLLSRYGSQHWWPGGDPFEIIVGAILTQAAAWTNVEKALGNLKGAGLLTFEGVAEASEAELASLLRPSGYYNTKARKLKAFVSLVNARYEGDLGRMLAAPTRQLWDDLLGTYGIGPETADSILLYAAERPVFVIDAYMRRVFRRLGLGPASDTYDGWREWFMGELPPDVALYNEYHALIVRVGKEQCRKQPLCEQCPLLDVCETGRRIHSESRV